ncbi:hypothetical protein C0J52_09869 [Blattella germanica]|nr:hypothetical protein C0J52_09869 [Blattella germanica]
MDPEVLTGKTLKGSHLTAGANYCCLGGGLGIELITYPGRPSMFLCSQKRKDQRAKNPLQELDRVTKNKLQPAFPSHEFHHWLQSLK